MRRAFAVFVLALAVALGLVSRSSASDERLWQTLQTDGHFALLRHAIAPGTGDPAEFALRDCSTQRNLSAGGRTQAARIGKRFRANGIATAKVFSSQWCRCLDTAKLLDLGPVEELPALNSFFRRTERRAPQTQELMTWIAGAELTEPTVLVTHQVNITALTGVFPASGELVILRFDGGGTLTVVGTITTDGERDP